MRRAQAWARLRTCAHDHAFLHSPLLAGHRSLGRALAELAGRRGPAGGIARRLSVVAAPTVEYLATLVHGGLRRTWTTDASYAGKRRALPPVGSTGGCIPGTGRWRAAARGSLVSLAPGA